MNLKGMVFLFFLLNLYIYILCFIVSQKKKNICFIRDIIDYYHLSLISISQRYFVKIYHRNFKAKFKMVRRKI